MADKDPPREVPVVAREEDNEEEALISSFIAKTCDCSRGTKNTPCSDFFPRDYIEDKRNNCLSLSHEQLDILVIGSLSAHRRYPKFINEYTKMRPHRKEVPPIEDGDVVKFRCSSKYFIADLQVCAYTFSFLHAMSKKRLEYIQTHMDNNGPVPRVHGSTGKLPSNSYGPDKPEEVVTFIRSIAGIKGLPIPGRMPSVNLEDKTKLPSDMSKASMYRDYEIACEKDGRDPVGLRTFKNIWLQYVPDISPMRPQTDMCDICQQNNSAVIRSACMPDEVKQERHRAALDHIEKAAEQRDFYNKQCNDAREEAKSENPTTNTLSFDYAQNVTYPHSASQVGPAYFKTARRCGLFGILSEGRNVQTNYVIDECETVGKGSNTVISMLDHYLNNEPAVSHLKLHADNCTGQNKNNALIQYLMWRTITGRNKTIELSFMVPGHTKFGPDRMFGHIKRKYYLATVDTLDDILTVVNQSTLDGKNKAVATYDYVRQQRNLVWRDWASFLKPHFKNVPSLLSYQHFMLDQDKPGIVEVRGSAKATPLTINVQKSTQEEVESAGYTAKMVFRS